LVDTLPGIFTITTSIPTTIPTSAHYRFRILAAIPYIPTADNGSDISIGERPTEIEIMRKPLAAEVGTTISVSAFVYDANSSDSVFWDFGPGANPATIATILTNNSLSQTITYSTAGDKKITISAVAPGGCSRSLSFILPVYDCNNPVIPHDAIVVSSDTTIRIRNAAFWVNPGFTLILTELGDTVFAEPGSTIVSGDMCLLFMKHGSVITQGGLEDIIIYADGASVTLNGEHFAFSCPTLDFDYTNAPPNAAHPLGITKNLISSAITLSPNPTSGIVAIHYTPSNDLRVSVMNLLGETVMELKNLHSPDFTLDLSKLVPGTYYIRFSSANSVVTKMVVRE
jgi:hypothetical protein